MTRKVALLVGGWSAERQVSLDKGKAVEKALREAGYEVSVIDVQKDVAGLVEKLTPAPDAVFNNLHGQGGEDGQVQSVLEILGIPYTHSGVLASAIGMDKPAAKRLAQSVGVRIAEGVVVRATETLAGHVMPPPYVVKPVNEGSSVGVRIVMEYENQPPVDGGVYRENDKVLVERYIPGRELTVAVLDGKAQAVTEIVSQARFFDYEAKYSDARTQYVLPANIPQDVYKICLDFAERVYNVIGCSGLARCDFRYDDTAGQGPENVYFLEINTQPGLTPESIGPSQVVHNGMSFTELCSHLVETAKCQEKTLEPRERPSCAKPPSEAGAETRRFA